MESIIKNTELYEQILRDQTEPLGEEAIEELLSNYANLQPEINEGMIGHVAHGKTSLTAAISGVKTEKFTEEKRRNRTIKLGYANFKIYKCTNMFCPPPNCYRSFGSNIFKAKCNVCGNDMALARHMSFVDCPGHEMLMRCMLNGAAVMDSAILVIATNQAIPQPQTAEHLVVAEIMGLQNIITVQNKCDLVERADAFKAKDDIVRFLKGSSSESAPIIPISCSPLAPKNIEVVLQYLAEKVPIPKRDLKSPAHMKIIRSFDVNKPGTDISNVKGGVVGGSLVRGILSEGEVVEIRPGLVQVLPDGSFVITPIVTRVVTLFSEKNRLRHALPGGLIAVGLTLDPTRTKKDGMVGHVLGRLGTLPNVFSALQVSFKKMRHVVGDTESTAKVSKLKPDEQLSLAVGSLSVPAVVISPDDPSSSASSSTSSSSSKSGTVRVRLITPVCAEIGDKVAVSRRVNKRWRLVGWGNIVAGLTCPINPPF